MSIQQPRVTKFISNSFLTNERRHICLIDAGLPSKTEDHLCFRNHTRSLLFAPQWSFKLRNDIAHMLLSVDLQKSSFVGLLHFLLRVKNFITRHKQYNWVVCCFFLLCPRSDIPAAVQLQIGVEFCMMVKMFLVHLHEDVDQSNVECSRMAHQCVQISRLYVRQANLNVILELTMKMPRHHRGNNNPKHFHLSK